MRDDVRQALFPDDPASMADRTIDITTTGRRSGEARRIETVFYRVDGTIYLSGLPGPRPRAWLLNLAAEPHFPFHPPRGGPLLCRTQAPRQPPPRGGSRARGARSGARAARWRRSVSTTPDG